MNLLRLFVVIACLPFAGCSSLTTRTVVDLAAFKHIYVVQRLSDDRRLDKLFVAELQKLGHEASSGPLTLLPERADAILTYADRWEWDFKTYLIELNVELHTARTEKKLADGHYYAPSPKSRPSADIVHDLTSSLLKSKPAK